MSGKSSSPGLNRLLYILLSLVALFILLLLLFRLDRLPLGPSVSTGGNATVSGESSHVSVPGSLSNNETGTGTDPQLADPDGLSFTAPIPLTIERMEKLALPEEYADGGVKLLRILSDGRLILQTPKRLSIVDPADMSETVIKTADFGLQAVANDRYIVFGIGGDEVFTQWLYVISSGDVSVILEDDGGYFGFEIDEKDHFYTRKIEALTYGKGLGPRLDYDLVNKTVITLDEAAGSLALNDLLEIKPDADTRWSYEEGKPWFEAWRADESTGFALEIAYANIYREIYQYRLYRLDYDEKAIISEMPSERIGSRPRIYSSNQLFVFDDLSFFDAKNKRWYVLETRDEDEAFAIAGITPERDCLYLTKYDRNGRSTGLWSAYPDQTIAP